MPSVVWGHRSVWGRGRPGAQALHPRAPTTLRVFCKAPYTLATKSTASATELNVSATMLKLHECYRKPLSCSIKSQNQHERLRRRRFLAAAAATAIVVETDAKITASSAILSKWRHLWLNHHVTHKYSSCCRQQSWTCNKVDRVEFNFVASVYRA